MKKNEMKSTQLSELSANELFEKNGGTYGILIGLAIAGAGQIFSDWDNFKRGLCGQKECTR
jgi:hypothetical protein